MATSHLFVCIILCTYYVAHGGDEHGGFATVLTSRSFQPEAAVCSTSRGGLVWFGLVWWSAHQNNRDNLMPAVLFQ
jgi:hypothetical protein